MNTIKWIITVIVVGFSAVVAAQRNGKPNIIFLLTDDQRWDSLGCMGNPVVQTPNIDEMAAHGALFKNMYVSISICAPSRACFLSGQYAQRHGVHDFATPLKPQAFENTYPAILRNNGYYTGFVGKYGVGQEKDLPRQFFDYWHDFLNQCPKDKPFCLSISFKAPHCQDGDPRQFIYDPADEVLYKDVTIPPAPASDPAEWEKFPDFFKADNEARTRWEIRFSTPKLYQTMVKGYYRLITEMDRAVGDIRKKLKEKGIDDNTVIIFAGDNGFFLGEHGMAGKWYAYEQSIRVPLVIYDPRLPDSLRGRKISEIALNVDVAPTILSLAGATVPQTMQGESLVPLLENKPVPWRQDFYYEHLVKIKTIPQSEAVVSLQYKYIVYPGQVPLYEELFDLQKDPLEQKNLAGEAIYKSVLEHMRIRLTQLRQKAT